MRCSPAGVLLVMAFLAGCAGTDTSPSPSSTSAHLLVTVTPNPARVGTRPLLSIRETAGVGVTATKATFRRYDANGVLLAEDTFTDRNAWFTCDNTTDESLAHLPPMGECTLLQSTRQAPSQFEFDQYVTDDNGHDLTFTSPREITIP